MEKLNILVDGAEGEMVSMFVSKGCSLKRAIIDKVDGVEMLVKFW